RDEVAGLSHSRFPVAGQTNDDILGFVHIRDILGPGAQLDGLVAQIARPVISLPQSAKVLKALTELRAAKAQLAIVQDEYGGTAGIVTIEDLVEELIGDITDEFDTENSERMLSDTAVDIDGLTTLEEFEERFGYTIPEGPYDTVAGFVMAQLGHLPQVGDQVEVVLEGESPAAFELAVTELDGKRAARVRCTRLAGVGEDEDTDADADGPGADTP
ncbi:MAG: CBS domain-containing protein, partial [Propionibacteriaceae bacterium]|nr:CBS domain-containing protein [Propionibacteriaceae bacterium]